MESRRVFQFLLKIWVMSALGLLGNSTGGPSSSRRKAGQRFGVGPMRTGRWLFLDWWLINLFSFTGGVRRQKGRIVSAHIA